MKKCFALFLVLTISLFTLGGCASRDDAAANGPPDPSTSVTDPAENNEPNEEAQNQPDENGPATETSSQSSEGPEDPEEIAGIIAMTSNIGTSFSFNIFSINPETGERTTLADLAFPSEGADGGRAVIYMPPVNEVNSSNVAEWVSQDFSKIAATKTYTDDTSSHAGWFDANGIFFDVTEALGLQSQSDFADPVYYTAIGFTEDNCFAYYSTTGNVYERTYYIVPLDNLAPEAVQEGNPLADAKPIVRDSTDYYYFTDWLDDTHYLADHCLNSCWHKTQSVIIDAASGSVEDYIPGDSRYNWNGIVSPDATQIAFFSVPKQGSSSPQLYVANLIDGEPVAIDVEVEFSSKAQERCPSFVLYPSPGLGGTCTVLLDWR